MKSERRILNNKLRRRRELRKNLMLCFLSVMLVVTLSISCFGFWSNAQAKDSTPLYKYYTSIEVMPGDTLWSIAGEHFSEPYADYNEYIEEVMEINSLHSTEITSGSFLVVPYYSSVFLQ